MRKAGEAVDSVSKSELYLERNELESFKFYFEARQVEE